MTTKGTNGRYGAFHALSRSAAFPSLSITGVDVGGQVPSQTRPRQPDSSQTRSDSQDFL